MDNTRSLTFDDDADSLGGVKGKKVAGDPVEELTKGSTGYGEQVPPNTDAMSVPIAGQRNGE